MPGLLADLKEDLKKIARLGRKEEVALAQPTQTVNVRIEKIKTFQDVENILSFVQNGNIVFLMPQLRDLEEYRKSIEKLKKVCNEMNGDIIGIGEENLLLVPSFVKIVR